MAGIDRVSTSVSSYNFKYIMHFQVQLLMSYPRKWMPWAFLSRCQLKTIINLLLIPKHPALCKKNRGILGTSKLLHR